MPVNYENFKILKECKGNKANRIFIVEEKSTNILMILKIIKINEVEKQLREIEVHKKLNHKFVIKLIDYDVSKSYLILLIEYAKYGDLFTHLPKLRELPEKTVLKFFFQVLLSINYLHTNGFVHRDIKPENILITRKFSPRIADFGTSVKTDFIKNTFCGTLEYMAPEILLRQQQSDKIDVWALGILLYEMTHNCTPFKNENVTSIKNKIETMKIRFRSDLNLAVKDLIIRIIKFKPEERPTCKQILCDPLFADFQAKIEKVSEDFSNNKSQQFQKMIDLKVQNKLKEFKNSVSAPNDLKNTSIELLFANKNTLSKMSPGIGSSIKQVASMLPVSSEIPKDFSINTSDKNIKYKEMSFKDLLNKKAHCSNFAKEASFNENNVGKLDLTNQIRKLPFIKSTQNLPDSCENFDKSMATSIVTPSQNQKTLESINSDKKQKSLEEPVSAKNALKSPLNSIGIHKNMISVNLKKSEKWGSGLGGIGPHPNSFPVIQPFVQSFQLTASNYSFDEI